MDLSAEQITITRLNNAKESPTFYKVFTLVGLGLMIDAADVYMASSTNTAMITSKFATKAQGSTFLSAGFLGLFIGSIIAGYFGDYFGRRKAYQANLFIFGAATLLGGFAPNIAILSILRFIATIGLGAEIVTAFATINEFAPTKHRGRWSGAISVIGNIGSPLGFLLCMLIIPDFGWRPLFFIIGIAALILWAVRRHNFPESPRWLISKGRHEKAEKIIEEMSINGYYDPMQAQETNGKESRTIHVGLKRAFIVGIIVAMATTVCQYTFTSWVPTILVKEGVDIFHSLMYSTVMMIGAPLGALVGASVVDRAGRKWTIGIGFLVIAILGIIYTYQKSDAAVMIIGFCLTMAMYAMNASILSVYVPELFPTKYRFRGEGYAAGAGKLMNVLMPYFIVWLMTNFATSYIFYSIAILAIIASIVTFAFGPETKQRYIR